MLNSIYGFLIIPFCILFFLKRNSYDSMVLCVVFKDGRQNVRSVAADLVQALIIYRWHLKIISLVERFYVCEIILEVSI